jgi:hypothetical protein
MILMPAVIVGGHLVITVADRPPTVNFEPTCRAAATGELRTSDRFETCVADEKHARDQLAQQWASFDPGARARCARMSTAGHSASYIELLTCLEMDQSARKRPGHDATTGIFFTAPERPMIERDAPTDAGQNQPAPIVQPPQQPVAAAPAQVVPPRLPGPPMSLPPPVSSGPPPLSALLPSQAAPPPSPGPPTSAPLTLAAPTPASPPSPPQELSQEVSSEELLRQSFCRSPLGYVLPNCR